MRPAKIGLQGDIGPLVRAHGLAQIAEKPRRLKLSGEGAVLLRGVELLVIVVGACIELACCIATASRVESRVVELPGVELVGRVSGLRPKLRSRIPSSQVVKQGLIVRLSPELTGRVLPRRVVQSRLRLETQGLRKGVIVEPGVGKRRLIGRLRPELRSGVIRLLIRTLTPSSLIEDKVRSGIVTKAYALTIITT